MTHPKQLIHMMGASLAIAFPSFACAQLPSSERQPWLGYFAGYQGRRFTLGITTHGEIKLTPLNDKGDAFGPNMVIPILVGIEEVPQDGEPEMKLIRSETLKSLRTPTHRLDRVVIQGQVSAGAAFEAVIEQNHGIISIGGKVLDKGQFKKHPIRFAVRAKFPEIYPWTTKADWRSDDRKVSAFLEQAENDRIEMVRTDGKRILHAFDRPVNATSTEPTGPGISRIEIRMHGFANRTFHVNASENSAMTVSNTKGTASPLYGGFAISWTPDGGEDKDGMARFSVTVR